MNLKKPKFWDYKKPNIIAYLLLPIAFLIQIFVSLFRKTNAQKFKIKIICVGNIYIGGTGKTSLSIKLNQILNQKKIKSCFVKKFYKNQIDEQNLLRNNGKLFLSSKRIDAITKAEKENYDVVILDDGLQDKSIEPDINLVCFNNANWIGNGMTIPAGPLREKIDNLKYYEHIFLNGNLENLEKIKEEIIRVNSKINIHIGKYEPVNIDEFNKEDKYLVFSGIGNHKTFISMLNNNGIKIIKDIEFSDHHKYKKNEIDKIINEANRLSCKLITTEKDFLRLEKDFINKIKFVKSELKIIDEEKFIKAIV
tara:strand:- start:495 stop:1421 length:927 start_codon:yes stop_codon:yes gene_type:complete